MIRSINTPKAGSYYSELLASVYADGRKWYRVSRTGERTEAVPFTVVTVALREYRNDARMAIGNGALTVDATGATYLREV